MTAKRSALAVGLFALFSLACPGGSGADGGSGGGSAGGGTGGGSTGGGSGGGTGGGTGGGSSVCGAVDSSGGPAYSTISLFQEFIDLGGATAISSFATASFASSAPANNCTITAHGPCNVVTCPTGAGGGSGLTLINGGNITISTPTIMTNPLVLVSDATGHYGSPDGGTAAVPQQVFSGGDPITVDGTGGGPVTTFHTQLAAPSFVNVNDPTFPDGGTMVMVHVANDLTVTWDVVDTASACVGINIDAPPNAVRCSFPASAGSGVVPSAALQSLQLGAAGFNYSTFNQTLVEVPGFGGVLVQAFELQPGAGGTVLLQ